MWGPVSPKLKDAILYPSSIPLKFRRVCQKDESNVYILARESHVQLIHKAVYQKVRILRHRKVLSFSYNQYYKTLYLLEMFFTQFERPINRNKMCNLYYFQQMKHLIWIDDRILKRYSVTERCTRRISLSHTCILIIHQIRIRRTFPRNYQKVTLHVIIRKTCSALMNHG